MEELGNEDVNMTELTKSAFRMQVTEACHCLNEESLREEMEGKRKCQKMGGMKAVQSKWANSQPRSPPKALVFAVPGATAPPSDEALGFVAVSPTM